MSKDRSYGLKAVFALSFVALFFTSGCNTGQNQSIKVRERLELRDGNGQVITTLWPERRDLFLLFANSLAKEYNLSMHTIRLSDGVAIEFGPRPVKSKPATKSGLDQEVILTVSNGKLKRTFHINESEVTLESLSEIWLIMGYMVGCSTGGDRWYLSRKAYVAPEPYDDKLGAFTKQFISASISRDADVLAEMFAETVHFGKSNESNRFDHISNVQAAQKFVKQYPADRIVICRWGFGVEGQGMVYLAGESKKPEQSEWFILFWAVKVEGKYVISQLTQIPNFWTQYQTN